jgi:hypothetical protein
MTVWCICLEHILCNSVHLSVFLMHFLEISVSNFCWVHKYFICQAAFWCLTITACTSFLAYTIPTFRYGICGFHAGVDEGSRGIVRDIVWVSKLLQTFWRSLLPPCPGSEQSKKGLLMTYTDVLFCDIYIWNLALMHFIVFVHALTIITHLHQQMHII